MVGGFVTASWALSPVSITGLSGSLEVCEHPLCLTHTCFWVMVAWLPPNPGGGTGGELLALASCPVSPPASAVCPGGMCAPLPWQEPPCTSCDYSLSELVGTVFFRVRGVSSNAPDSLPT